MNPDTDITPAQPASTDAHPLHCPRCGYDLQAIPEDRCPECGLGYDHASVRWMADDYSAARLSYARRLFTAGALSVACALGAIVDARITPLVVELLWFLGGGALLAVLLAAAFARSWRTAAWAICGAVGVLILALPPAGRFLAPVFLVAGWCSGPAPPLNFPRVARSAPTRTEAALQRWKLANRTLTAIALGLIVIAWW